MESGDQRFAPHPHPLLVVPLLLTISCLGLCPPARVVASAAISAGTPLTSASWLGQGLGCRRMGMICRYMGKDATF